MATTAELVVRDGTGQALVPARTLILTRAPEMARLGEMTPRVAAFDFLGLDNHDAAADVLKEVRAIRKHVEAFHDLQKGPLNEVRAVALDLEKRDVGAWKALETGLGAKLLAFDAEMERQRKAEEARLTREALVRAQAEADAQAKALREAAKAEDDLALKRQLNAQARQLKDAPVFVAPVAVASPVAKTSTTTRWSAEIVDVLALVQAVAAGRVPLAALEPERLIESHPWLNTQATQLREEFAVPGCVAVQKTSLSGR